MKYGYDGAGSLIEAVYPANMAVTYQYDQAGRLIKVPGYVENFGGAGFVYSRNGFLQEMYLANGAQTTYTTSAAARNRPTQIETKLNGNPIFNQTYDWDYAGNVTQINGQPQQYDALQRLTTAITPTESVGMGTHEVTYTYDLAGNRMTEAHGGVTRTYSYDSEDYGNAIAEVATTGEPVEVFAYHPSGAIKTRVKDDVTTKYLYDGANRLTKVNVEGQTVAEYTYDAHGRLIETVEHLPGGETRTTRRIPMGTETAYEEVKECDDLLSCDTWEFKYIRANGRNLARVETFNNGTPQTHFYHSDHLGSTRTVSEGSGVDSELAYDAYGNVINTSGNADGHTHRFTGKPQDSTGLYYYGARFYDPTLGRYISLDPAMDGLNWYAYTYNNPLKYVDPDGQCAQPTLAPEEIGICVGAFIPYDHYFGFGGDGQGPVADDPDATSRVQQTVVINFAEKTVTVEPKVGESNVFGLFRRTASVDGLTSSSTWTDHSVSIDLFSDVSIPYLENDAPGIKYQVSITASQEGGTFTIRYNPFPAHEGWLYSYGEDPVPLFDRLPRLYDTPLSLYKDKTLFTERDW